MLVSVTGNIGSGKTTLTTLLSKHYKWTPHFEEPNDNPYLNDFYKDMQRWSFNLQVYFMAKRIKKMQDLDVIQNNIVQDKTLYEDAYIFAPNLHSMGLMTSRDFETYSFLFKVQEEFITPPDILIYLRADVATLVTQIQKRGREYEKNINIEYLKRLNERYEAWISDFAQDKLIIIDVKDVNFSEDKEALSSVIQSIDAKINGLF